MLADVLSVVLALAAVASGVLVFRLDSMARVTFALLASFLFASGEVLLLGLTYLGLVVLLMMVIEMVIMAVFMIMYMMNPAGLMPMSMFHNQRGSLVISAGTFLALAAGVFAIPWPRGAPPPARDATFDLGVALMGSQMLTMMALGLTLFAAIVGTVLLATHRGRYDRYGDRLDAERPEDPMGGGVGR
jgi:NADH-quinone oxidoreductase subunit J